MDSSGGKIVEEKANKVDYGCRFKDHRITAGSEFDGILGTLRLFAGSCGKCQGIKLPYVCGICFGPTRRRAVLHGDGKFRLRLPVGSEKTARIALQGLVLPTGKHAGSHLAAMLGDFTRTFHGAGALFRIERCSCRDKSLHRRGISVSPALAKDACLSAGWLRVTSNHPVPRVARLLPNGSWSRALYGHPPRCG